MKSSKFILLPASLALCAWPLAAGAQQAGAPDIVTTGEVEAGVGIVTDDSYYFNEYTGITDTDPYFFGNMEFSQRAASGSNSSRYVEFRGQDLGLPTQSLYIEAGRQGSFSVFGEYDAIPHLQFDDGQTPYSGAGSTNLNLPPGWVPDPNATGLTNLDANDLEIRTERERVGAGFSVNFGPNWTLSTAFRSEDKTGVETLAGIFGSTGGNMRAGVLPTPVDRTTHQAEMVVGYSTDRLQADIRYNLSLFDNNKNSLTWENPYTANAAWDPSQDYANGGQGRMALEPNNSAHQLSVALGYMLGERTRLAGSLSLGRMIQDDDFLPYTINSSLSVPTALPRASLDGEVNTIHANLGVTTQLTQNADLKAAYTYDDRDNQTPVDTFLTVPNDSIDQGTTADSRARRNRPYSRQSHKVELEAGYRLTADTKLSAEYDFEAISRDLQEVDDTTEHTVGAKVRSNLTGTTSGSLSYAFSTRSGSTYDTTLPYLVSHDPDYLTNTATLPDDAYEQNPYLRKFYMSDRDSHLVKGGVTFLPSDRLALGLNASYRLSDYDATLGLTESSNLSGTIDASYMASDAVNLSGFFTYDTMESVQVGWARTGFVVVLPSTPVSAADLWEETVTDRGMTVGLAAEFGLIEDTLDVALDVTYSRVVTEIDFVPGANVTADPLPDLESDLISIGIRGDYHLTEGMTVRLGYRYETFEVKDFALDNVDEAIAPAAFGLGNASPDYDAHVVAGSLVVKF